MSREILSGLAEFLNKGIGLQSEEVPPDLIDTNLVSIAHSPPDFCPDCGDPIVRTPQVPEDGDGFYRTVCVNGDIERVDVEEVIEYQINHRNVFELIAEYLDLSLTDDEIRKNLPRYAAAESVEGVDICLVYRPRRYDETVKEIITDALEEEQVTVLVTPQNEVGDILELIGNFPVGSLLCPIPLTLLYKEEVVRDVLAGAVSVKDTNEVARQSPDLGGQGYFQKASRNPHYVASELNFLRVLRENGELTSPKAGGRFEEICGAAFAEIFALQTGFGGEDNPGENLPDLLFRIDDSDRENYRPLLGVVDTKSSSEARFYQEKIERKHRPYLQKAKRQPTMDHHSLAHIFVVFDVQGHQEIDFYHAMDYDSDTTMVVIMADALMLMFASHLSIIVNNELTLSQGNFRDVVRPFFDREAFYIEEMSEIRKMTRLDDDDYDERYRESEGLIVVTAGMVERRLKQVLQEDSKSRLEHIFEAYRLS